MVRDHRLHPGHVLHRLLASRQPQAEREQDGAPAEDGEVDGLVVVHLQHEGQHDHGHRGAHVERHERLRVAPPHVVERVDGRVHQDEHDDRRGDDHREKARVRHAEGVRVMGRSEGPG